MGKINKTKSFTLLTVFMVFLIASTSTTTVTAAPNWGTLKAGDEMQWHSTDWGTITIKVLNVEGKTITLEAKTYFDKETYTLDADASMYDFSYISPWLLPKSKISDDLRLGTQNYEWQGTTYKAYYEKSEFGDGSTDEDWYDFNTGILFESRFTDGTDGSIEVTSKLLSTNADLAEASSSGGGGCFGTIFITLVSVTTIISYAIRRYHKSN
jgi:hypothetical protein